uniref:Flavoprotein domain-containing protein n=1 Tax=Rhodnius prolixus TaxID=13249 RepID=T1HR01_RHOPR
MQGMLLSMTNLSTRTEEFHFRVVLTEQSRTNINNDYISKLTEMVYTDEDEWNLWQRRGDPVLHIDLTKWADVLVVAPLDMNTLAKIAVGICDNLLTCIVRAWNIKKPLILCPALPAEATEQILTKLQIGTLKSWGYDVLLPEPCAEASSKNCYAYPMVETDKIADLVMLKMSVK